MKDIETYFIRYQIIYPRDPNAKRILLQVIGKPRCCLVNAPNPTSAKTRLAKNIRDRIGEDVGIRFNHIIEACDEVTHLDNS